MHNQSIKDVQDKILEIMKYIDKICRDNNIIYYIMGGTALGAVRHGGFIPWDDDLDIFMTPDNYEKFKSVFNRYNSENFVLQEWKTVDKYLEYAKVRMNGTTFIEESFQNCREMHHGIYVDIMILHKCPNVWWKQKLLYIQSKFVTLYGLSLRNWKPKTKLQLIILYLLKIIPKKRIANWCYKNIYAYDSLENNFSWCYFITPAKFKQGIFDKRMFENPVDIEFEGYKLYGSRNIKEYLKLRYGDYLKLPSEKDQKVAIHAMIYHTEESYEKFLNHEMDN